MKLASTILATGILATAVLVAPTNSQAQITPSGKKYVLRMKWTKGQKLNYNLSMALAGQKPIDMGLVYEAKSLKGTSAVVDVSAAAPGQKPNVETVTIDDRGRVSGTSTGMSENVLEYPAGAIGIGDSWKTKATFPGAAGGLNGTAVNTLKGIRTENGKKYMHIESKVKADGTQVSANGVNNVLVGMDDGQILRSSMNMELTSGSGAQKQTMKMVVTIARK